MHAPHADPVLLGHESTGVVVARGREVTYVDEGDMVLVTWVPRNFDKATRSAGTPAISVEGTAAAISYVFTWADFTLADEQYVVQVPRGTRRDVTAIIGCAVMTGSGAVINTAGVQKGQSVAIFGVGGVGLCAVAAAAIVGADPVIAVDLDDFKLDMAKKFGATVGINAREVDPVERIRELTPFPGQSMRGQPRAGVDFAFDCIGSPVTMAQILPAAKTATWGKDRGGTAILVGVPTTSVEIQPRDWVQHEKTYTGSLGGSCVPEEDFPVFLEWFREGRLDLDALVTTRYQLDQINEATDALHHGEISGRAILEF
jgi:Zn-dependent alcohol dehydrogenase